MVDLALLAFAANDSTNFNIRTNENHDLFCFLTPFRHLSKRPFIHTGGDRGKGVRGERRGMAGMPRTRAV